MVLGGVQLTTDFTFRLLEFQGVTLFLFVTILNYVSRLDYLTMPLESRAVPRGMGGDGDGSAKRNLKVVIRPFNRHQSLDNPYKLSPSSDFTHDFKTVESHLGLHPSSRTRP
jgi:hypothetical protein